MAEKRAYNRLITDSYCDIDCAIADHIKIKDIGIGGICLETSRHLKINSIYSMNFVTNEIGKKTLKGKVVWSTLRRSIKAKVDIIPIYHTGLIFIEHTDGNTYLEKIIKSLDN